MKTEQTYLAAITKPLTYIFNIIFIIQKTLVLITYLQKNLYEIIYCHRKELNVSSLNLSIIYKKYNFMKKHSTFQDSFLYCKYFL